MTAIIAAALAGAAAGWLVERHRARHRLAQLVDVDAVRAAVVDQDEIEAQLAEQTMRAARYHRWWRIAQQVARAQAELLAAGRRHAIPVGPDAVVHAPKHLRSAMPLYGARRSLRGAA